MPKEAQSDMPGRDGARLEGAPAYVAPPEMVVADGGSGFAKARGEAWPSTRVQRCVLHAFCQVKRYTTSRPNL